MKQTEDFDRSVHKVQFTLLREFNVECWSLEIWNPLCFSKRLFLEYTFFRVLHIWSFIYPSLTFHQINLSFSKPVTILQIKDKKIVKVLQIYAALYFIAKYPVTWYSVLLHIDIFSVRNRLTEQMPKANCWC